MKIETIVARQLLDSRGNPTIEVAIYTENGTFGRAMVPSGASTGEHEALELRDNGPEYHGKSVQQAIDNITSSIAPKLFGKDVSNQQSIDDLLLEIDGTENKSGLGANATLGVSLAVAHAAAAAQQIPLYKHIADLSGTTNVTLPRPMINIINGGQHAPGATEIQEFMIFPKLATDFRDTIRCGSEIFHQLKKLLSEKGLSTTVGDEGGFVPGLKSSYEILDTIMIAIEKAGYKPGEEVEIALDVAASEFFTDNKYILTTIDSQLNEEEMIEWISDLTAKYPISSIEDALDQNAWPGWSKLQQKIGDKVQLVGDDLLVTNKKFLEKAIEENTCNAILIKPNQIGTLSETLDTIKLAKEHEFKTIVSHRSGETEDVTIAHLAVGVNAGQIKTGSMSRGERTAKYNELLRISENF